MYFALKCTWGTGQLCFRRSYQGKTCSFPRIAPHWCAFLMLSVKEQVLFLCFVYLNYFCSHFNFCWKSRVQRKKEICLKPQTPSICAYSSLSWTYTDTLRTRPEGPNGKGWRKLSQSSFHSKVSACSGKSQSRQSTGGFYHDTGRMKQATPLLWGLSFLQATSTLLSRKMSLGRSQLCKEKNKGQSCPCLHYSTNTRTSLRIHWLSSRHQYFSARNVFHTQIMPHLIVRANVPHHLHCACGLCAIWQD